MKRMLILLKLLLVAIFIAGEGLVLNIPALSVDYEEVNFNPAGESSQFKPGHRDKEVEAEATSLVLSPPEPVFPG